jgi:hypothetical protein
LLGSSAVSNSVDAANIGITAAGTVTWSADVGAGTTGSTGKLTTGDLELGGSGVTVELLFRQAATATT